MAKVGDVGAIYGEHAEDTSLLKFHLVNTEQTRNTANELINKMYSGRGYGSNHDIHTSPQRLTLAVSDHAKILGTITVNLDSEVGIHSDENFKDQIDLYRSQGRKVCELIKFAFKPDIFGKQVGAALFHIAFIHIRYFHKCTDLFIEVSPKHCRLYERMLGFKQQGDKKLNLRVNNPSFLLRLDLHYAQEQIRHLAGSSNKCGNENSLYPYFFALKEETEIKNKLSSLRHKSECVA